MRLTVVALGRQKAGPEGRLVDDYLDRAGAAGRPLGLGPARLVEIDDRKLRGPAEESARALAAAPEGAALIALDERGRALTSRDFADLLARLRDEGRREACFFIGGADGHDAALTERADLILSFGPMVWPHMLARVMLAEQLYRAATILAGAPYHRD